MRVREAYRDVRHSLCREHYADPPEDFPALGPVEDARDGAPCEVCGSRPGRPSLDDEPRSERLELRVTPARKAAWQGAADAEGVSLSQWLSDVGDEAARGLREGT